MTPLIWITRAQPAADDTAARVTALGLIPLVDPVLQVRLISGEISFGGMGAVAFTSRNGVEAFTRASGVRDLKVFAVGDATADAARRAGFADVTSARGDGAALARLIARDHDRGSGAVLLITPREPAVDMTGLLQGSGVNLAAMSIYETVERRPETALSRRDEITAVLVHSAKAAAALARLVQPGRAPDFACLSDKVAAPLREAGFRAVQSAEFPDEDSLLRLLAKRP